MELEQRLTELEKRVTDLEKKATAAKAAEIKPLSEYVKESWEHWRKIIQCHEQ